MIQIVITPEQVGQWEREKEDLEYRLSMIQSKLNLVYEIRKDKNATFMDLPPAEAIKIILRKNSKELRAGAILEKMLEEGYPKEKLGHNISYFYARLKHLADTKQIIKIGNKYSIYDDLKKEQS